MIAGDYVFMFWKFIIKFSNLLLVAVLASFQVACTSLNLPPPQEPIAAVSELMRSNIRQLNVQLIMPPLFDALGYQYLLFMPFSKIKPTNVYQHLKQTLIQKLALCGYNASIISEESKLASIKFEVTDLSCSAYDLFFVRDISCEIALISQRLDRLNTKDQIKISNAQFKRFGFSPELLSCLHSTANQAIDKALFNLGLCDRS